MCPICSSLNRLFLIARPPWAFIPRRTHISAGPVLGEQVNRPSFCNRGGTKYVDLDPPALKIPGKKGLNSCRGREHARRFSPVFGSLLATAAGQPSRDEAVVLVQREN